MRSLRENTADRRLLTPESTAKAAGWKCVFRATLRLQRDVMDLSVTREFACAPATFRWRFTRNKGQKFSTVATFCNNGHDERSQTVLAPSFPSRREVGDQCSDPAAGCFGPSSRGCPRSAHPRSSVVPGRQRRTSHLRLEHASSMRTVGKAGGPLSGEGLFTEHVGAVVESHGSLEKCPQLCGELVNTGGASPS